jgi:hypothetical protein
MMRASRAEGEEVRIDEHGAGSEGVGISYAFPATLGRHELEQSRPEALEPTLLDQPVREETRISFRAAEGFAQLSKRDGLLPPPLKVENNSRFILG